MTLDICRLLFNVINKQMKIQHNARTAGVYRLDQIPANVKDRILGKYGKDFLGDANLLVFFRGLEDKKSIQKLFKTIDNALGNDANLLVVGDFKKLSMNDGSKPAAEPDDDEDAEAEMSDDAKIQNDVEEVLKEDDEDDLEDGDMSDASDEASDDTGNPEDSDDSDDEGDLDSDSDTENTESGEEQPEREVPGEYVFIKITIKD